MKTKKYSDYLAKTFESKDETAKQEILPGQNIFDHSVIVGLVARELIQCFPEQIRKTLFPSGSELIASCHDIGKISPYFQAKLYQTLTNQFEPPSFQKDIEKIENPSYESNWSGHAGVSEITAECLSIHERIPRILGRHHGFTLNLIYMGSDVRKKIFGGEEWQSLRLELIEDLKTYFQQDWPNQI
jgi:CRISPR-associated endonuclease/helicase Cas3